MNQYGAGLSDQDFSEKCNFHPPITVFYGLRQCILKELPTLRYDRYQAVLPHNHEFNKIITKNKQNSTNVYDIFMSKVHVGLSYIDKLCVDLNLDRDEFWY